MVKIVNKQSARYALAKVGGSAKTIGELKGADAKWGAIGRVCDEYLSLKCEGGESAKDKGTGGMSRMPKWGKEEMGGKPGRDWETSQAIGKLEQMRGRLMKVQRLDRADKMKEATQTMKEESAGLWEQIQGAAMRWMTHKQGGQTAKCPGWKVWE